MVTVGVGRDDEGAADICTGELCIRRTMDGVFWQWLLLAGIELTREVEGCSQLDWNKVDGRSQLGWTLRRCR